MPGTRTITVTGDEQVIRQLRAKGDRAIHLAPVMRDVAGFSERQIRGIPVRSGRLAGSTRGGPEQKLDIDNGGFQIGTITPYSGYVFAGTKHMRARPPQINTSAITRRAEQQITEHLRRT